MVTINHDYTYGAAVERDEEGYFINFPAFDGGAFSDGDTLEEAAPRAATALRLAIADYLDNGEALPNDDLAGADMVFCVEVSDGFIKETRVDKSLRDMSALQLRSLAALRGIEIEPGATKTEIIDALASPKPSRESLDSIRDAEEIVAEGKPGYSSVEEMFEAMGVEGVPRDMAAALELARESKATATVKLKLSIEEYLKLEIIAADRRKSAEELLREQVESLTKG